MNSIDSAPTAQPVRQRMVHSLNHRMLHIFITCLTAIVFGAAVGMVSAQMYLASFAFTVVFVLLFFWPEIGFSIILISRSAIEFLANSSLVLSFGYISTSMNPLVAIAALLTLFGILIVFRRRIRLLESPIAKTYIIFFSVASLSIFVSISPGSTFAELARSLSVMVAFLLALNLYEGKNRRSWVLKAIVASAVIPASVAVYQLLTNTGLQNIGYNQLFGTFLHPNDFGRFLILVLGMLMALWLSEKPGIKRILYLLTIASLCFLLFETFSRGTWLGFLLLVLVFVALIRRRLLIPIVAILLLIVVLNPANALDRFSNMDAADQSVNSLYSRYLLWEQIWPEALKTPLVGKGFGVFTELSSASGQTMRAHNEYLRLFAEVGIFGLLSFLAIHLVLILRAFSLYRTTSDDKDKKLAAALIGVVISFLAVAWIDNVYAGVAIQWYLFAWAGLIERKLLDLRKG